MDFITGEGRTVMLVSHDINALVRYCGQGLLMDGGRLAAYGPIKNVIRTYLDSLSTERTFETFPFTADAPAQITALRLLDHQPRPAKSSPMQVQIEYFVRDASLNVSLEICLERIDGLLLYRETLPQGMLPDGHGHFLCSVFFPAGILNSGTYQIRARLLRLQGIEKGSARTLVFNLHDQEAFHASLENSPVKKGLLAIPLQWKNQKITREPLPEIHYV